MPSSAPSEGAAPRAARRVARLCEAAVVLAWLLFVLRYQYGVASLAAYGVSLDVLFLGAIAGAATARGFERRGSAAMRSTLLRLAFMTGVTVLALLAAEYAARFAFRQARSSGNARDFVAQHGTAGPAIRSNNLNFRDRDVPSKTDRYRIVVVGDSFTWGQGIDETERFSNVIEAQLGPRYEVFNFGRPGNNMPEHLDVLTEALGISPDFVLLQLYINDFETPAMERPRPYPLLPEPADSELERSSILYDLARAQWARLQETVGITDGYVRYMERNLRDPNAPNARQAFGQLREFFDRAKAAHVGVGAVLFPAPDAMGKNGANYPFGFIHERVRAICAAEDVRCLDLLAPFSAIRDPRTMWVSPFDAHPNAMANRKAAMEILQTFATDWQRR